MPDQALTWICKDGKHVAESKARPAFRYVIIPSRLGCTVHTTGDGLRYPWTQPFADVVDAKKACQYDENRHAEQASKRDHAEGQR